MNEPLSRDPAHAHVLAIESESSDIRKMSTEERGRLLKKLCEAAAAIEKGKRLSNLPASAPAPWPDSTWEYQRRWTKDVREKS